MWMNCLTRIALDLVILPTLFTLRILKQNPQLLTDVLAHTSAIFEERQFPSILHVQAR